ncbi:hypothetical protein JKF63_06853 [Porcisia hertigi]|uniref:Uncharacterized protein n=1 Tax=Porcisia hertigi TaxID=2761500 RepID=A0A836YI77_9TRYP|nr:hypothetical protein JKF63_06853 [Porcisia hertigi]
MTDDVSHIAPFTSSPSQQPPQDLVITESVSTGQAGVAANSAARASDHATTATQATSASFNRTDTSVTLAALRRLAASSKPSAASTETLSDVADASCVQPPAVLPVLFTSNSMGATQSSPIPRGHRNGSRGNTILLPRDSHRDHSGRGDQRKSAVNASVLPWWKRILVDAEYRRRLMQLCTEGYHEELRLLHDTPELLSSGAGMEVRKVWRERRWMDDDLERGGLQQDGSDDVRGEASRGGAVGIGTPSSSLQAERVNTMERGAQRLQMAEPMMDEVDEVVVMAQHVVFCGQDSDSTSHFSTKHPRCIMNASTLESVQRIALDAMPPIQHERERERQVHAVKRHLSTLRRFSRETPYEVKASYASDVLAGRVDVPMQTAITDAVMDEQDCLSHTSGGKAATRPKALRDIYSFPPPKLIPSSLTTHLIPCQDDQTHGLNFERIVQLPMRKPHQPPTPQWMRPQLPPGMWAVETLQTEVTRTREMVHASLVRDPLAVEKRAAAIKDTAEAPTPREGTPAATEATTAAVAVASNGKKRDHDSVHLRRQEAAAACVNGIENLYGLQSVWRSPLPPGGFLRVSPDPRFAMWPDSEDEDEDEGEDGLVGNMAGSDNSQGRHLPRGGNGGGGHHGVAKTTRSPARLHKRQAQMHRLARRVNHQTHKLRYLHSMGHRRVCYGDLELCDSDDDSASSTSAVSSLSQAGHTSNTTSVMRKFFGKFESKVAKVSTSQATSAGNGHTCNRQWRSQDHLEYLSRGARPVYSGALNINVYAECVELKKRNATTTNECGDNNAPPLGRDSRDPHRRESTPATTTRRFLGCYRQSRLLIHFKLYCRALYEEERLRCSGPCAHVIGNPCGGAPDYTPATTGALAGVPTIPHPVLKLQVHAPSLRKPYSRRVPILSTISGCRCWEGLYPDLGSDPFSPAQHAWQQLRQSILVRQALRDIFDELPHDKEGLLDKRTFVLFVLQLLELFFPTHLPAATHVAIAEEEWVYRGTTEHVGPQTFHEKFFLFPLIFHRNIAAVTEDHLVEFWTLVRVCLHAQRRVHEKAAAMHKTNALPSSSSLWAGKNCAKPSSDGLSLLIPLTHFTREQLDTLLLCPPPAFDADVYDRYCLLRRAFRYDPKVRTALRSHQYAVARSVAEKQHQENLRACRWATDQGEAAVDTPTWLKTYRERLSVADPTRRADVEATAQRELDARQRQQEAQEHDALLENSEYYQARTIGLQSRAATIISGIENISSNWDLHQTDLFVVQQEEKASACQRKEKDMEDLLLEYLSDVPREVFDGDISLRGRYLLNLHFQEERRKYAAAWTQLSSERASTVALADSDRAAATLSANLSSMKSRMRRRRGTRAEGEGQRYMAMTTGCLGSTVTRSFHTATLSPLRAAPTRVSSALSTSRVYRRLSKALPRLGNEASMSEKRTAHHSGPRDDGNSGAGASKLLAPFPTTGSDSRAAGAKHIRTSTTRGAHLVGRNTPCSSAGVSSLGSGRSEEDIMSVTRCRWGPTTACSESLHRKMNAARQPRVAHSATPRVLGTLPPPVPLPQDSDRSETPTSRRSSAAQTDVTVSAPSHVSPALQHLQLLSSSIASSAPVQGTTWPPSALRLHLSEADKRAAPRQVHWATGMNLAVTQVVSTPPKGPRVSSTVQPSLPSASELFVQRLRAQQRRRKQFKRQFHSATKIAARVVGNH